VRLTVLDRGQRLRARLALGLARRVTGRKPDEIAMISLYRPAFFGRPWLALVRDVLRGPSPWSAGERELFAAFVSRLNRCRYCAGIHSVTATLGLRNQVTVATLDQWREATESPADVRAVFGLLDRVVTDPDALSAADVEAARAAGMGDDAVVDALYVAFVFNLVNRLANAFGCSWETEEDRLLLGRILHRTGYRVPGFLLR